MSAAGRSLRPRTRQVDCEQADDLRMVQTASDDLKHRSFSTPCMKWAVFYNRRMNTIVNDLQLRLAGRLKLEREARHWSIGELAKRSGVSKAMISKMERGEVSPTAALLGRISA